MTPRDQRILRAFLVNPEQALTGIDLIRATGLGIVAIQPSLLRFERLGLVEGRWADTDAYPRRRLYTISARGIQAAQEGAT